MARRPKMKVPVTKARSTPGEIARDGRMWGRRCDVKVIFDERMQPFLSEDMKQQVETDIKEIAGDLEIAEEIDQVLVGPAPRCSLTTTDLMPMGRTIIYLMRPDQTDPEMIRHELQHMADRLDPDFGYDPLGEILEGQYGEVWTEAQLVEELDNLNVCSRVGPKRYLDVAKDHLKEMGEDLGLDDSLIKEVIVQASRGRLSQVESSKLAAKMIHEAKDWCFPPEE